jgi:hypothetical protein
MKFGDDAVDPILIGMKIVKTKVITHQGEDEDAAADAQGEAQDVDACVGFVFPDVAPGYFEKIFEHKMFLASNVP